MRYSEAQVIAARQRYADATDPRYYSLTEVWLRQEKFETFVGDGYVAPAPEPNAHSDQDIYAGWDDGLGGAQ
jgi:hypothetical protein